MSINTNSPAQAKFINTNSPVQAEISISTDFHISSQILELSIRYHFAFWIITEDYIKEFGKQKGFIINRH